MRIRLSEKELHALRAGGTIPLQSGGALRKYNNRRTVVDGMTFDSKAESERYLELNLLQFRGLVVGYDLKTQEDATIAAARQQRIPLEVNGIKVTVYQADFVYRDLTTGEIVIEDLKGYRTATYKLKARLFAACLGFPITETGRKERKVR